MKQQLDDAQQAEGAVRDSIIRFAWLGLVVIVLVTINGFVMLKIVPVYERMFYEFELELPTATRLLINISNLVVKSWDYFFLAMGIAFVGLMVLTALGFVIFVIDVISGRTKRDQRSLAYKIILVVGAGLIVVLLLSFPLGIPMVFLLAVAAFLAGWFPRDLPVIWRLFRRYDGAMVMRGLAVGVRRGLPLPQALSAVADHYPIRHVARLLGIVEAEISFGHVWHESLRRSKLISRADAAVLAAAERVGNLPWALEEMAESALRRQLYWTQIVLQFLFPPVLLLIGLLVAFVVVSLFLPLIALVQGLS
jgi:type II secretory pathway component PulF